MCISRNRPGLTRESDGNEKDWRRCEAETVLIYSQAIHLEIILHRFVFTLSPPSANTHTHTCTYIRTYATLPIEIHIHSSMLSSTYNSLTGILTFHPCEGDHDGYHEGEGEQTGT